MVSLDMVLDTVMELPFEERENLMDIVKKRQSELWREATAEYYNSLKDDLAKGKLKPQSIKDVVRELDALQDSEV
jgi:hypothetical protein